MVQTERKDEDETAKPLLAFECYDGNNAWEVRFGLSDIAVRRAFADKCDMSVGDIGRCGGYVRRAHGLDQYAPGPVPPMKLLELGGWLECYGCGKKIDGGDRCTPTYVGNKIFCCPWCRLDDITDKIIRRKEYAAVKSRLSDEVRARWPGTEVVQSHAYVRVHLGGVVSVEDASIDFSFPGGKYPARYRVAGRDPGSNGLYISYVDREAWAAFDAGEG